MPLSAYDPQYTYDPAGAAVQALRPNQQAPQSGYQQNQYQQAPQAGYSSAPQYGVSAYQPQNQGQQNPQPLSYGAGGYQQAGPGQITSQPQNGNPALQNWGGPSQNPGNTPGQSSPGQRAPAPSQQQQGPNKMQYGGNIQMQNNSTAPQLWYPQQQTPQQATWQPQQQQQSGGFGGPMPVRPSPVSSGPQQSLEQQALTGGRNQAQSISNLQQALKNIGAGGNNTFMNQGPAQSQTVAPMLSGVPQSNGNSGSVQYAGGFNGGQNAVSYNYGLGSQGPTDSGAGIAGQLYSKGYGQQFLPKSGQLGSQYAGAFGQQSSPMVTQQAGSPQMNYGGAAGQAMGGSSYGNQNYGGQQPQYQTQASQPRYSQQYTQQSQPTYSQNAGGAAAMAMSDEREKKDIAPSDKDLKEWLDPLKAYQYRYKDEKNGRGEHFSVMAQDLEKSKIGRSMVEETPDGKKMVNYARKEAVQLAAMAMLNERIKRLEKNAKGKR